MKQTFFEFHSLNVRRTFGFGAMALALAILPSCSDESDPGKGEEIPQPELSRDSYTVKASDASRIINYADMVSRTNETASSFDMGECPSTPEDAKDLTSNSNLNYGTPAEGVYVINVDEKIETGLVLNGNVIIHVEGELNLSYLNNGGEPESRNTIYVHPGGKLTFSQYMATVPGLDIYNYGELGITHLTVGENSKIYSYTDISCESLGVNKGAEFKCKGSVDAGDVRLNGDAVACAFVAENKIEINGEGTFQTSYFEANELEMNTGNIVLDNNGLIKVKEAYITNEFTRVTVNGNNAVFAAEIFKTNNKDWPKQTFFKYISFDIKEAYIGSEKCTLNDFELQISNDNNTPYVPAAGCHGEYPEGTTPPDPEPEVVIEKITDIEPLEPSHDHGIISATCITFAGNKAYASYHLRGLGQKGCIEVIEDNGDKLRLTSYMISPDYDFNHIIVDGQTIIPVGNHKKKDAFIGALPIDFEASEGVHNDFKVKELTTDEVLYEEGKNGPIKAGYKNAGDGNCVIRHNDYYYVNTYRGFGALNLDFSKVEGSFHATNGSSKHVSVSNGKTAILSLNSFNEEPSAYIVNIYDANDYMFNTVMNTYSAGMVAPIDGKNVVAIDGEDVYACLGKGGLVRFNDGKEFHAGANGQVPANGVAVDENYVYVAMGSFVFVLDKINLTEVTHYHASTEKSANYIALHNGKIYVAFGEDGIQVFRLNKK